MHITEPLVPDPSPLEEEITTVKLNKYKLPGVYQFLAEIIQAEGEIQGAAS
jgi:hypothetical protein